MADLICLQLVPLKGNARKYDKITTHPKTYTTRLPTLLHIWLQDMLKFLILDGFKQKNTDEICTQILDQ